MAILTVKIRYPKRFQLLPICFRKIRRDFEKPPNTLKNMVPLRGLEPPTY